MRNHSLVTGLAAAGSSADQTSSPDTDDHTPASNHTDAQLVARGLPGLIILTSITRSTRETGAATTTLFQERGDTEPIIPELCWLKTLSSSTYSSHPLLVIYFDIFN